MRIYITPSMRIGHTPSMRIGHTTSMRTDMLCGSPSVTSPIGCFAGFLLGGLFLGSSAGASSGTLASPAVASASGATVSVWAWPSAECAASLATSPSLELLTVSFDFVCCFRLRVDRDLFETGACCAPSNSPTPKSSPKSLVFPSLYRLRRGMSSAKISSLRVIRTAAFSSLFF
jgi:hypothetical protein